MNEETRSWVELLALQLAGVVVAAHVYWGLDRFAEQLRYGVYVDPRPALFVLSSGAIIAGVAYVALGGRRRPVYALGIGLMLVYVFGYWGWHLMGHLPALPWVDDQAHPHPGWGPVETLFRHLEQDDLALVSKLAEIALAIVLAGLWFGERQNDADAAESDDGSSDPPAATESETDRGASDPEVGEAAHDPEVGGGASDPEPSGVANDREADAAASAPDDAEADPS